MPHSLALAGGIAGMCGVAAGAPLDIVRVRQQQANQAAVSALRVLRDIVAREGRLSLFKGLAYPLYTASFQVTIRGNTGYSRSWEVRRLLVCLALTSTNKGSASDRARPGQSGL